MAFRLCQRAEKTWIRLHSPERLAEVIEGVKFVNGINQNRIAAQFFRTQLLTITHIECYSTNTVYT